jgi:hypothetical protein
MASSSATSTLTIANAQAAAAARYRCVVSDACGVANGTPATLSVCDHKADLNCDGRIDLPDLATLLTNFGTPSGAMRDDGDVDLSDLSQLLSNFGATCP